MARPDACLILGNPLGLAPHVCNQIGGIDLYKVQFARA
jgi:hypothetical protein